VAEGVRAIEAVRSRGGKVFLDLKLHDILKPWRARVLAMALGAELLTLHTAGGLADEASRAGGARRASCWA